jgi:hypothetical protein
MKAMKTKKQAVAAKAKRMTSPGGRSPEEYPGAGFITAQETLSNQP